MLPRIKDAMLNGVRSVADRFSSSSGGTSVPPLSEEESARRRQLFVDARQYELELLALQIREKGLPSTNSSQVADRYLLELATAAVQLEQHGGDAALREGHVGAARAAFVIATRLQFLEDDFGLDAGHLAQTAMRVRRTVHVVGAIAANEVIELCGGGSAVADMILGGATPASIVQAGFRALVEEEIARHQEVMAARTEPTSSLLAFSPLPKKTSR